MSLSRQFFRHDGDLYVCLEPAQLPASGMSNNEMFAVKQRFADGLKVIFYVCEYRACTHFGFLRARSSECLFEIRDCKINLNVQEPIHSNVTKIIRTTDWTFNLEKQ